MVERRGGESYERERVAGDRIVGSQVTGDSRVTSDRMIGSQVTMVPQSWAPACPTSRIVYGAGTRIKIAHQ